MKPRVPTPEDCAFWEQEGGDPCVIIDMVGRHLGAEDIKVIKQGSKVRVPWVQDDRDLSDVGSAYTTWTTFWGGMPPTDIVVI